MFKFLIRFIVFFLSVALMIVVYVGLDAFIEWRNSFRIFKDQNFNLTALRIALAMSFFLTVTFTLLFNFANGEEEIEDDEEE